MLQLAALRMSVNNGAYRSDHSAILLQPRTLSTTTDRDQCAGGHDRGDPTTSNRGGETFDLAPLRRSRTRR